MLINGNSKWDSRFSIRLSLRRRSDHGLGQKKAALSDCPRLYSIRSKSLYLLVLTPGRCASGAHLFSR